MKAIHFLEPGSGHWAADLAFVEYHDRASCAEGFYRRKNPLLLEGLELSFSSKTAMDKRLAQLHGSFQRGNGADRAAHAAMRADGPVLPALPRQSTLLEGVTTPVETPAECSAAAPVKGARPSLDIDRVRRELGYPPLQGVERPNRRGSAMHSLGNGSQTAGGAPKEAHGTVDSDARTSVVVEGGQSDNCKTGARRRPATPERGSDDAAVTVDPISSISLKSDVTLSSDAAGSQRERGSKPGADEPVLGRRSSMPLHGIFQDLLPSSQVLSQISRSLL